MLDSFLLYFIISMANYFLRIEKKNKIDAIFIADYAMFLFLSKCSMNYPTIKYKSIFCRIRI